MIHIDGLKIKLLPIYMQWPNTCKKNPCAVFSPGGDGDVVVIFYTHLFSIYFTY